ncbi:MAG: prefoldin subunit alpha [Thermoplasmata archaeon]
MENDKILNQLIEASEILKKQIEGLNLQLEIIKEQIDEHNGTIETLNGYSSSEENDIYMDAGSSTYISLRTTQLKSTLIRIGSDIYVEYDIKRAIEILNDRINDLKSVENKAMDELKKLSNQYNAVQDKLERIYSEMTGRNKNVQGA